MSGTSASARSPKCSAPPSASPGVSLPSAVSEYVKVGRHVRIPESAVRAYIDANTVEPSAPSQPVREGCVMAGKKRRFGRVRKLPSGRYQARYLGPDGIDRPAPHTFETALDADDWLAEQQTALRRGDWIDPEAGAINFEKYATQCDRERDLAATTHELYRRLLRLHILPAFGGLDLDEITPPAVRAWRAERRRATGATTVAKSYRLLKAILQTAVDDEAIRRNPCRIKGAGKSRQSVRWRPWPRSTRSPTRWGRAGG